MPECCIVCWSILSQSLQESVSNKVNALDPDSSQDIDNLQSAAEIRLQSIESIKAWLASHNERLTGTESDGIIMVKAEMLWRQRQRLSKREWTFLFTYPCWEADVCHMWEMLLVGSVCIAYECSIKGFGLLLSQLVLQTRCVTLVRWHIVSWTKPYNTYTIPVSTSYIELTVIDRHQCGDLEQSQ